MMSLTRRAFTRWGLAACAAPCAAADPELVVFAAASLTEVLRTLAAELAGWRGVRFSFAASSTLARQIEQGAPAHVFISADEAWMDHLATREMFVPTSRRVLAGNRLVVVRSAFDAAPAALSETTAALNDALRGGTAPRAPDRVATGDPAHVPVGRYAQLALTQLGLWPEVAPRLVRADSVRSALAFVERGEAAAGIVYATDALVSTQVRVAARFPRSSHPPIRYPAAVVRGAAAAAAALAFLDALASPQAQPLWRAAGFEAAA